MAQAVGPYGVDAKNGRQEWREAWSSAAAPRSGESHKKGYYEIQKRTGFSINQDVMFTADKTWGGFGLNVMAGMNAFYRSWDTLSGYTQGGLSIPGYYSLKASVNPALAASTMSRRRSMSLYGKATLSWKSMAYVDVTARNDCRRRFRPSRGPISIRRWPAASSLRRRFRRCAASIC